jgi:hypothetical protein
MGTATLLAESLQVRIKEIEIEYLIYNRVYSAHESFLRALVLTNI